MEFYVSIRHAVNKTPNARRICVCPIGFGTHAHTRFIHSGRECLQLAAVAIFDQFFRSFPTNDDDSLGTGSGVEVAMASMSLPRRVSQLIIVKL